jgi:CubicO group peptidase (beta-lactamase class C family)
MRSPFRYGLPLFLLMLSLGATADEIDDVVRQQMQRRHIPGVSIAIIQGGKIIQVRGYGFAEIDTKTPVTPSTLFQAASISKSVTALGVLSLVEKGQLSLDENVNAKLTTWKLPENEFTREKKVTLRRILSHTAGLTVHGFLGYAIDDPMPTLLQVLNGEKPSNSAAIRVDIEPGSQWRYSGDGYTVMQQMILDVTGVPFPEFMQQTVLTPLHMTRSSYEQPLPADKAQATASGYYPDGTMVKGHWHVHPEMAAAGLWTTPSDLARFAIGVQQSLVGTSTPVISQAMTRQMLTTQVENDGLGLFLEGSGRSRRFTHSGRNVGFDSDLVAYAGTGQGAAVMINTNNSAAISRIEEAIAREYHWRDYIVHPRYKPLPDGEPKVTAQLTTILEQFEEGKYNPALFTPEIGTEIKDGLASDLLGHGPIRSLTLVECKEEGERRVYRYRVVYKHQAFLMHCALNKDNVMSGLEFDPD